MVTVTAEQRELEQAQNQIDEARQKATEARQQIQRQKLEAEQARVNLQLQRDNIARQQLEVATQRDLRNGRGIEATNIRAEAARQFLLSKQRAENQLKEYESSELTPYEQQVAKAEAELASNEAEIANYESRIATYLKARENAKLAVKFALRENLPISSLPKQASNWARQVNENIQQIKRLQQQAASNKTPSATPIEAGGYFSKTSIPRYLTPVQAFNTGVKSSQAQLARKATNPSPIFFNPPRKTNIFTRTSALLFPKKKQTINWLG